MPPSDTPARIRAAIGHSRLGEKEIAAALNMSVRTLARIKVGERPLEEHLFQVLADVCDVPVEFLREGFAATLNDQIVALWQRIFDDDARHRGYVERARVERHADTRDIKAMLASLTGRIDELAAMAARIERLLSPPAPQRLQEAVEGVQEHSRRVRMQEREADEVVRRQRPEASEG